MRGDEMSIISNKTAKIKMDTDILQVEYNSTVSAEIQCKIALTGSKNIATICSTDKLYKAYCGLKELFAEIKKD